MEMQLLMSVLLLAQTLGDDVQITKTKGFINFKQVSNSVKRRTWTLHPPQNRTNVYLSINMVDYKYHSIWSYTSKISFPDETEIDAPDTRLLEDSTFCRVFVKDATVGQLTCKEGVKLSNICEDSSLKSEMWPPTITAKFKRYSVLIYYEFVDCRGNETGSTASVMTTESMKNFSKATESNQMTSSVTDTATQGWTENSQSTEKLTVGSFKTLWNVVIVLTLLLIIVVVLFGIGVWKYRNISRNTSTTKADNTINHYENVTEQITSAYHSGAKPDVSSFYALAEKGDGNEPDEKRTVDNELYQLSEKEEVSNELYECTP